jgi:hypothetical protein
MGGQFARPFDSSYGTPPIVGVFFVCYVLYFVFRGWREIEKIKKRKKKWINLYEKLLCRLKQDFKII